MTLRDPPFALRGRTLEIPEHELLAPIASGAYGQVWLARNALGTLRAVKIVRRDRFERKEDFEREFRGLQRFEPISRGHDALVDVLQIGQQEDWFYHVMELADDAGCPQGEARNGKSGSSAAAGQTDRSSSAFPGYVPLTLRQRIRDRGSLPAAEVVALGCRLASALDHMHSSGLVHRDVKPPNILFVNGQPKLADAGLVTTQEDAQSLVGTPGYIPPEGPGTSQGDIFSLGKVLYEAAFGKSRQEFPQLPADLATWSDHAQLLELNDIVVKACANDPRKRYASAAEMLKDLELLGRGESVIRAHQVAVRWERVRTVALWGIPVIIALTAVRVALGPSKAPVNSEARSAYLAGRAYLWINEDINMAADSFERALAKDPNSAAIKAALATTYSYPDVGTNRGFATLPRAKDLATEALATTKDDLTRGLAYLVFGWYAAVKEWDWTNACEHFERALQLTARDPQSDAQAHEWYGMVLGNMGRTNESVAHLKRAVELDPESHGAWRHYSLVLSRARRYEEALRALEHYPQLHDTPGIFGGGVENLARMGQIEKAMESQAKCEALNRVPSEVIADHREKLKNAWREGGMTGFARKLLELYPPNAAEPLMNAQRLSWAGEVGPALDLLEEACRQHDPWLACYFLRTNPNWDNLRGTERFQKVLKSVGLSQP
jgi:tetratricopeptide (TPR) repeat protein